MIVMLARWVSEWLSLEVGKRRGSASFLDDGLRSLALALLVALTSKQRPKTKDLRPRP